MCASKNDIKIVYRQLARKYHPDLNKDPDAKKKFFQIHEAYLELLNSDLEKIKFHLRMNNSMKSLNEAIESMNKAVAKLVELTKQDPKSLNEESLRFFI